MLSAIKASAPGAATYGDPKKPGISGENRASARNLTPKEFAGALTERGIPVCERTVRNWCEAGTVETVPGLPGRWLIPAGELARFTAPEVAA